MLANKILEVKNLKKSYGSTKAVDGINLDLHKGECLALLGPNGAGKTTTIEMLEGLIPQDSGEIIINGLNYQTNRQKILEIIGVQLQECRLYGKYTVKETFDLFSSFYKCPTIDSNTLLAKLHLEEKANIRLEKLSGGQRQRVYLGCCIINDPLLLFLDEPTSALDPQARRVIWDLISQIKSQGRCILLTTHHMDEAEKLADRIAIIDQGKIITLGTPQELVSAHCISEQIDFRVSENIDPEVFHKEGSWRIKQSGPCSYKTSSNEPERLMDSLIKLGHKLGFSLTSFSLRQGTLEDVFIKLTGRTIRND